MRFFTIALTLAPVLWSVSAQTRASSLGLPKDGLTYYINEINLLAASNNFSMTPGTDREGPGNVFVHQNRAANTTVQATQRWVIKDFNATDNTTALWNESKKRYAGYQTPVKYDTELILTDTPMRFQFIPSRNPILFIIASAINQTDPNAIRFLVRRSPPDAKLKFRPVAKANNQLWYFPEAS